MSIRNDLTLRDYFAAQALVGIMANASITGITRSPEERAEAAYRMADAMLEIRLRGAIKQPSLAGDIW